MLCFMHNLPINWKWYSLRIELALVVKLYEVCGFVSALFASSGPFLEKKVLKCCFSGFLCLLA